MRLRKVCDNGDYQAERHATTMTLQNSGTYSRGKKTIFIKTDHEKKATQLPI